MQTEVMTTVCDCRVLVLDDERSVLDSLHGILEPGGFTVESTTDLSQAIRALQDQVFQLVITDLYVGERDLGFQLAEAARETNPPTPVVMLTGRPSFYGAQEALRSQVAEIVVKPVDPESLLSICRRTVESSRLRQRANTLEAQNDVLARILPNAIEAKDPTTSGHADRVVCYTDSLAKRCGLNDEVRTKLRLASLLHDVGKIGIPDAILTKPGGLTLDEREIIERHPRIGYDMLAPLEDGADVRRWVYQHHERWDGKGYPEKIGGEEVDMAGRILILAEVYDALAEKRSYKPAWPDEKIAALFRDEAGRHFDPELATMVADGIEKQGRRFWTTEPGMLF